MSGWFKGWLVKFQVYKDEFTLQFDDCNCKTQKTGTKPPREGGTRSFQKSPALSHQRPRKTSLRRLLFWLSGVWILDARRDVTESYRNARVLTMGLRLPIPAAMREKLSADTWMKECLLSVWSEGHNCAGRVEWQHGFTYAGKRKNELWAIIPMCHEHHKREASFREEQALAMRYRITLFDAEKDFREKYPRSKLLWFLLQCHSPPTKCTVVAHAI